MNCFAMISDQLSWLQVSKNNENKGRPFYTCSKRRCTFFQWADLKIASLEEGDLDSSKLAIYSVTRTAKHVAPAWKKLPHVMEWAFHIASQ